MVRTTCVPGGSSASMAAIGVPAATEITSVSGRKLDAISVQTRLMICGFTDKKTRSLSTTTSRFDCVMRTP